MRVSDVAWLGAMIVALIVCQCTSCDAIARRAYADAFTPDSGSRNPARSERQTESQPSPLSSEATLPRAAPSDVAVRLARVLSCESWASLGDYSAILHVLERRNRFPRFRSRPLVEVAEAYSSCDRSRSEWVRGVASGSIPHEPYALIISEAWLRGDRPADPCIGDRPAIHWGARSVAHRVECRYQNVFGAAR